MNHGFKLHSDGTLEITMPKGVKVGRVLVKEEGTQDGALYYSDGLMEQYKWERDIAISQLKDLGYELGEKPRKSDVPGTNDGNLIDKERLLDDLKEMCIISFWEANEHSEECYQDIYRYIESMPSAQPERWSTCFDCPLSHGCHVINGCTNEQAMQYAGKIPDDCPVNKISAEPEWKNGNWIKNIERFGDNAYHCSQCGAVLEKDDLEWRNNYYCYHCGSKMER